MSPLQGRPCVVCLNESGLQVEPFLLDMQGLGGVNGKCQWKRGKRATKMPDYARFWVVSFAASMQLFAT